MLSRLALAQLVVLFGCGSLFAQTVQLPTFNFTTVNTTVTIPDGGSALLGGVKRASTGSVERGVPVLGKVPGLSRFFRNRAIGQQYSSSMMRANARVVILDEMDQELLDQAARSRAARGDRRTFEELAAQHQADSRRRKLEFARRSAEYQAQLQRERYLRAERQRLSALPRRVEPQPAPRLPDLDEIRRQNEQARRQRDAQAVAYFQKGKAAEQAGKLGAARVYYGMALRRARNELKESVQLRLASLQSTDFDGSKER